MDGIVARVQQSREYYDSGARQRQTQLAARATKKEAQLKRATHDNMSLKEIRTTRSKRKKTKTEQGWL